MEPTPPAAPAERPAPGPTDEASQAQAEARGPALGEQRPARLRLRRAPRYRAFVLTGVLAGVAVALLVMALAPQAEDGNDRSVLGYVAVSFGAAGALLGGMAALLVERRRPRRVRH